MRVARGICKASREILKHRDMTRFEDLVFVNARTGKFVINKDFDQEDTCIPNAPMLKKLEQWGKENTIVLHNHPRGNFPSLKDITMMVERGTKYGVIACHDGTVMKYQIIGKTDPYLVNITLDTLYNLMHNTEGNDKLSEEQRERKIEETYERLRDFGFLLEVY